MSKKTKRYAYLQPRYNNILKECVKNIEKLGYKPSGELVPTVRITNNTRSIGNCRREWVGDYFTGGYKFVISCTAIIADDEKALYNTLYHEVIHTLPGCFNHGKSFKTVMDKVNDTYHTNITTRYEYEHDNKVTNDDVKHLIGSKVMVRSRNGSQVYTFTEFHPRARKYTCVLLNAETGISCRALPSYVIDNLVKD